MPSDPPAAKEKKKGRWRRLLKGLLWGLLVLLVLLAAFHRPLLRWGLNWGAPRLAKSAGYELHWNVQGSIVSDISIRNFKLRGPESAVLKNVECLQLKADYDLWALIRGRTADFMHELTVFDATVNLDTRLSKPKPKKEKKEPPDIWADRVNLKNIHVTVATNAGEMRLRGFTLLLDKSAPGELVMEELTIPSSGLHLTQVRGRTSVNGRTVTLADVAVTPDVKVARLEVGLSELKDAAIPFQIEARTGEGVVTGGGKVENLGKRPTVDVNVGLQHFAHTELARWVRLPADNTWRIENATLQLKGPPAAPRELSGVLTLDATGIHAARINADRLRAKATIAGGQLRVDSLSMQAGTNTAEISGVAALPPTWPEMKSLSAELQWRVDAPSMEAFFPAPSQVAGSVHGSGTVVAKEGRLGGAQGSLDGKQIRFRQWSFDSVVADVATDAESVQIKSLAARIGEKNAITVSGKVQLSGRQPADLTWDIKLGDVAEMARMAGWQNSGPLQAEKFRGTGIAHFEIADLREKNFRKLTAQGSVGVEKLSWENRRLQSASLDFGIKEGRAEIRNADIVFDERNRAHLTGGVNLEDRQPFDVTWEVALGDFSTMGAWLAWRPDMPQPQSGTFSAQGKASGSMADLREKSFAKLQAEGTAQLQGVVSGKARFDRAEVNFVAQDGRVDLKQFEAQFDEHNHLTAQGHAMLEKPGEFSMKVDGALPQIEHLSPWVEMFHGPALTGGSATVSWEGSGKIFEGVVQGNSALKIADLKMADRPAFSVSLETKHEGKQAQISALRASTGNFRIEAQANVSQTDLKISKLSVFSGDLALANGSADIPLALAEHPRPPIPLDAKRPVNISLHAAKLDLTKLFQAVGRKAPVSGMANADVELHGLLADMEGKIMLVVTGMRSEAVKGKLEPAVLRVDGSLAKQRLSLRATVDQKPLRTLAITGELPLDAEKLIRAPKSVLDSEVQARLVMPNSDLSIVRRFVPTIAELKGTVGADVSITGPLRSPHLKGALIAEAPSATFEKTPMDIKNLKARISFVDKHIKFDDVSAILAGGEIRATGGVDVSDMTNPLVDLQINAREALIMRNESVSARADGMLTIKGTLAKAEIAGRAELVRCRIFKEIEFLPLSLPNQLPPPPPPVEQATKPTLPPPMTGWTFNVDIKTRDPIRLLGNVLNGSATAANVHLGGTGAAPELEGEVVFDGARVKLPNSGLTVTRGKLIFTKADPFEPILDVQGDSLVSSYEVTLYASGPARKPKLRFASSPPLSEGEIATLLATGAAPGSDGTGTAGAAANTAAFMVINKAYRSIFKKSSPKRYDDEPGRLTFGTGGAGGGVMSATYEISPHFQATGGVTERGTFRGMLYYMVRKP